MIRSLPRPETRPSTSSPTTCLWTSVMSTSRPSPHIDEAYLAVCLFSVITSSFLDRHSTFPSPTYLSQCAHISAIVRESRGGIHVNLTIARRDSSDKKPTGKHRFSRKHLHLHCFQESKGVLQPLSSAVNFQTPISPKLCPSSHHEKTSFVVCLLSTFVGRHVSTTPLRPPFPSIRTSLDCCMAHLRTNTQALLRPSARSINRQPDHPHYCSKSNSASLKSCPTWSTPLSAISTSVLQPTSFTTLSVSSRSP